MEGKMNSDAHLVANYQKTFAVVWGFEEKASVKEVNLI